MKHPIRRKYNRNTWAGRPGAADLSGLSVCFDLDGTLVDTAPDLVRVTNAVISEEGCGPTDYKTARRAVGYGSRRLITDALARAGQSVTETRLDELQDLFLGLYAEDIAQLSQPYPGVLQMLRYLRAHGARLNVCTNKPGWLARPLLDELGLTDWFDHIVGGDDAFAAKPSPFHIWASAGHQDRSRIIMVGDSYPDIRAAHNARVPSILVTYGYTPVSPLRLRADRIVNRAVDIQSALYSLYRPTEEKDGP